MNLSDIAVLVVGIVNAAVVVIIGLSVLVIVAGIVRGIATSDSKEGRDTIKNYSTWGILGIVVAISTWGLVELIVSTF